MKPGGQSSDHPLSQPLHQVNFEIKGGASLSLQVYMTHEFTIQIPHLQAFFHQPMTRVSFVSSFFWANHTFPTNIQPSDGDWSANDNCR